MRFSMIIRLMSFVCLLPIFDSTSLAQDAGVKLPKGMKAHRIQGGEKGKDGWYEAKSTEGHFRVLMPIPFNDITITLDDSSELVTYMIASKNAQNQGFSVLEMKGKKPPTKDTLKEVVNSFREKGGWKVSNERYFKYQTFPAVEFQTSRPGDGGWSRYIQLPDRIFMLVVENPTGSETKIKSETMRFFDSLKIDPALETKEKK